MNKIVEFHVTKHLKYLTATLSFHIPCAEEFYVRNRRECEYLTHEPNKAKQQTME